MNDENIIGRMTCPNCGMERSTTLDPCFCGYNPRTGKVEEKEKIEFINERFPDSYFGINELLDKKETEFDKNRLNFYSRENVNWLQYVLIELILNFDFSESHFEEVNKYLKIGMDNKIYNGVPRLGQGNKVTDLAPATKNHFDNVFGEEIKDWRYNIIEDILIGWYDVAYLVIGKL